MTNRASPGAAASLPEPLQASLARGLAKDRRDRFPNMTVLAETLEEAAGAIERLSALPGEVFAADQHVIALAAQQGNRHGLKHIALAQQQDVPVGAQRAGR